MAIAIQRIEKEFLLGMLCYKSIPVKCFFDRKEYTFILQAVDEEQLVFMSQKNLSVFQKNMKIDLKFSIQSAVTPIITFSVYICEVADKHLTTTLPDYLYKNLQRAYSRVPSPPDMDIVLKKDGFYYDLNYEKLNVMDVPAFEDSGQNVDGDNIESLMNMNLDWIKQKTDGYKLMLFKNDPPATIEEKAVAKLGKILFISMQDGGFLPEAENSIFSSDLCFTEQSFAAFLTSNGGKPDSAQEKIADLLRRRAAQGICSDCFIPILFSSYIIGYVHVWVYENGNAPLTINMIDRIRQYTTIIAFFLERKNFFEDGKKPLPAFKPRLLDVSAGGFLFVLDLNKEKVYYVLNDAFDITITIFNRTIHCKAVIIRDYANKTYVFYGCKFEAMELEDVRFLFESIYGKPFTDKDLEFITGSV
jgi:hypothetical protein